MTNKDITRKLIMTWVLTIFFNSTVLFSNAQVGSYEYIDLNRATWPHVKFKEGGVDVARIQGFNGKFAVTSINGGVELFTVNTANGNAQLLSNTHRFYINEFLSFDPTIAGIRNNGGNPSVNAKDGGVLYLNRDVYGDLYSE